MQGWDKTQRSLNLNVQSFSAAEVALVISALKARGIDAFETKSTTWNMTVLRVVGENDIKLLRETVHGLSPAPMIYVPEYPKETHVHSVNSEGAIVVRRRDDFGLGKVDNPMGPAVVSPKGERYALNGDVVSFDRWAQDPRVVNATASLYARRPV